MTLGSHFMDGYIPDFDATIVTRLLDAGATIVGKMNMEDFSFGGPGVAGVGDFGRPLNPHNPDYVTGGSSSGSGCRRSRGPRRYRAGRRPGRLDPDSCRVVRVRRAQGHARPHSAQRGLRPGAERRLRRADDANRRRSRHSSAVPGRPPTATIRGRRACRRRLPDYVGALGQAIDGVKLGVLAEGFGVPGAEPDAERIVREALAAIRGRRRRAWSDVSVRLHRTVPLALGPLFLEGARSGYDTNFGGAFGGSFFPASFMAAFGRAKRSHSHELPLNLKLILLAGSYAHERSMGASLPRRRTCDRRSSAAVWRGVCPGRPPRDADLSDQGSSVTRRRRTMPMQSSGRSSAASSGRTSTCSGANTMPFNYTGFPAVSIPCGKSEGLPVGLQLVAPRFREDLLIRVAHAFQRAVDWNSFYPSN